MLLFTIKGYTEVLYISYFKTVCQFDSSKVYESFNLYKTINILEECLSKHSIIIARDQTKPIKDNTDQFKYIKMTKPFLPY